MARSQGLRPIMPCSWCKHPQYAHMTENDCHAHGCDCEEFVFPYFDLLDDERGSPTREGCRHHWSLPESTGDLVCAVCRRCGAKREFPSWVPSRFRPGAR